MKPTVRRMIVISLTAAVYTTLTLLLPIPAYGEIQCRLSEVLNLLAFINPVFVPGIIMGCFISNMFSSVNPVLDCIVGTSATAITMLFITKFSKNLFIASLWPTVFCVFIGGMIFYTSGLPRTFINFLIPTITVMLGEFLAMTVVGYPLFKRLLKNKTLVSLLREI